MCLTKIEKTCRKGRLTVYKVLIETPKGLNTPYAGTPVKLGEKLYSKIPYSKESDRCVVIREEGVHAYTSLESAIDEYMEWFLFFSRLYLRPICCPVIYEAIIPDVEYWLGTVGDIASVELLITNKKVYPK